MTMHVPSHSAVFRAGIRNAADKILRATICRPVMPCKSLDFTCRSNSSESFLMASIRTLNRFFSKKNFLVSDGRILFFDSCVVTYGS